MRGCDGSFWRRDVMMVTLVSRCNLCEFRRTHIGRGNIWRVPAEAAPDNAQFAARYSGRRG